MTKIGLLSDTHSYLDESIIKHLSNCDEIWHAGDFGSYEIIERLKQIAPLRGVYGNIDGSDIRASYKLDEKFTIEGLSVWMRHIGGYPGNYSREIRQDINTEKPDLFISGHSHILKVMRDDKIKNLLHLNPGAAGKHGFHKIRTLLLFEIEKGKIQNLRAVELGKRA